VSTAHLPLEAVLLSSTVCRKIASSKALVTAKALVFQLKWHSLRCAWPNRKHSYINERN
jgi:hypothetical protein